MSGTITGGGETLNSDAVAAFLASVFAGDKPRIRAVYEVLLGLIRNRQSADVAISFGALALPCRITEGEALSYGHIFDAWAWFVYQNRPRAEAVSLVHKAAVADIALNGQQPWNMLHKGATEFSLRNFDEAYACFDFVSHAREDVLSGRSHGSSSTRRPEFVGTLNDNVAKLGLAPWSAPANPDHGRSLVHLMACDGRYWGIFQERLFASLQKARVQTLTHIHIINPERSVEDLQQEMTARFPDIDLRLTSEAFSIPEEWSKQWNGMNLRAFYTFLRFLRAADILETYKTPVVITEFDAQVSERINSVVAASQGMEVGLIFYEDSEPSHFPWVQVWAGTVLLYPTPGAIRYIRSVANYCAEVFLDGIARQKPMWHVDQNALYAAYRHFASADPDVRIARFPDEVRPLQRNFGNAESR